jgi:hypothetical protein
MKFCADEILADEILPMKFPGQPKRRFAIPSESMTVSDKA